MSIPNLFNQFYFNILKQCEISIHIPNISRLAVMSLYFVLHHFCQGEDQLKSEKEHVFGDLELLALVILLFLLEKYYSFASFSVVTSLQMIQINTSTFLRSLRKFYIYIQNNEQIRLSDAKRLTRSETFCLFLWYIRHNFLNFNNIKKVFDASNCGPEVCCMLDWALPDVLALLFRNLQITMIFFSTSKVYILLNMIF